MKGERTRQSILEHAVDLASLEGLEGLTIGRLADELGMSKSGLFAHFGSKEELQLATIEAARERFIEECLPSGAQGGARLSASHGDLPRVAGVRQARRLPRRLFLRRGVVRVRRPPRRRARRDRRSR